MYHFRVKNVNEIDLCVAEQEQEMQRDRWDKFIKSRGGIKPIEDDWLWQYWRPESRMFTNKVTKALNYFNSRRTAQKKLKVLIRGGTKIIPV